MDCEQEFYLCQNCFHVADGKDEHHQRPMFHYTGFQAGDAQIKPVLDEAGNLKTRAPRWYVEKKWPHALVPRPTQE